jgi:Na+/proline symporter
VLGTRDGTLLHALLPFLLSAIGVASLPQLMARGLTSASRREAGTSMAWGILFAALLTFAGLILVELLVASMHARPVGDEIEQIGALLAALPAVLSGLALAGTLAALFAVGQAALFSATTALSHELFEETVDKRAPEGRRIVVARLALVGIAWAAASSVPWWSLEPPALLQWSLALAAAGGFVPVTLALRWKKCTRLGALAGMAAGFGSAALAFLIAAGTLSAQGTAGAWVAVSAPVASLAGLLIAAVVTVGLSLARPATDLESSSALRAGPETRHKPPIRERPA